MRDLFDNLRYDYPRAFRSLLGFMLLAGALSLFMMLPQSEFFRVIGVTGVQTRLSALYYAAFWRGRSFTNPSTAIARTDVEYGTMAGLDESGLLIVSVPVGPRYQYKKVQMADIKISNLHGAAALINRHRARDAKIDIYPDNQVVVWLADVPFNVKLIEAGYATPDPNPPTNIVDQAFSTYYLRIFYGD